MRFLKVFLACVLLTAVAACSDGDDGDVASGDRPAEESSDAPVEESADEPVPVEDVKMVTLPSTAIAPAYIAQELGYFEDESLNVEFVPVQSAIDIIGSLAQGELQAVFSGYNAGFFNALASGVDLVAVGTSIVEGPADVVPGVALAIAADRAGEITSVEDLRGKKVGLGGGEGGTVSYMLDETLREAGMTISDVEVVSLGFPDMPTALANDSVDAAFMTDPFMANGIKAGEIKVLAKAPPGTSGSGLYYNGEFAQTDAAQRLFNAVHRAWAHLQEVGWYDEEILEILAKHTGQDAETIRNSAEQFYSEDLAPLPDQLMKQQQSYMDAGLLDYTELIRAEDFVDTSFAENAAEGDGN